MAMRMTDPPRDDEHGQIPHVSEHDTTEDDMFHRLTQGIVYFFKKKMVSCFET